MNPAPSAVLPAQAGPSAKKPAAWPVILLAVAFPVLLAVHAPLSLLAGNRGEVAAYEVIRPTGTLVLAALILGAIWAALMRDAAKGALVAGVALLLALSYGHLYDVLKPVQR